MQVKSRLFKGGHSYSSYDLVPTCAQKKKWSFHPISLRTKGI
jgi:hypothetical protein